MNGFGNALKLDCTTADTSTLCRQLELFLYNKDRRTRFTTFKNGTSDAEQVTLSFYAKVVGSSTDIVVELDDAI